MKITVLSDTHNKHYLIKNIPVNGDVLIHCGDATNSGTFQEQFKFFNWFSNVGKYQHRIYVPGNHDIWTYFNMVSLGQPSNVTVLMDSSITIDGIKFWGYPWTPIWGHWAWTVEDKKREEYIENIDNDIDILISHGPPKDILDWRKLGCDYLTNKALKLKNLKYHFFGHIHEEGGKQLEIDNKYFYNCSIVNFTDGTIGDPLVLEI